MTDTKKNLAAIRTPLTKAQLFASIAEDTGLTKKQVAAVFESLGDHMHRHLKKRSAGTFTLPGQAKPLQISRRESAWAKWQKSMATNWVQHVNPLAARSAPCSLTRERNWVRGKCQS